MLSDPSSRRDRDTGAVTVLVAVGCCVLVLITAIGLQLAGAVIARHRAGAAADFAALAGALQVVTDPDHACSRAAQMAAANHAHLTSCTVDGWHVSVTVAVPVSLGLLDGQATARARAGPIDG